MKYFPDQSGMERSKDGTQPIRGGSMGFNLILGWFETAANTDKQPRFTSFIISAFTVFRNVWTMNPDATVEEIEQGFVKDLSLFMEYYDTYLSQVWSRLDQNRHCPVVVYFPNYKHVPKELLREHHGRTKDLFDKYAVFLNRHGHRNEEMQRQEHSRCVWIRAGDATYPHKEVARKFREIVSHRDSLYTTGDEVALITSIVLDYHMAARVRNLRLMRSNTAEIVKPDAFRFQLDPNGNVPFQPAPHAVLGDKHFFKPQISTKIKRQILDEAGKDRWLTRSAEDVRNRLARITEIPVSTLRRYDFD